MNDSRMKGALCKSSEKQQNWSQIDWVYHREKDVRGRNSLRDHFKWTGALNEFFLENLQIIAALILSGILCGFLAAYIDVAERWLTNIKDGLCIDRFWLPQSECCMRFLSSGPAKCPQWAPWSTVLRIQGNNEWLEVMLNASVYTAIGTLLASLSSSLAVRFAPYAVGGGILELKMIASGTFIHSFLSFRTLVIKVVALSLSVASGMRIGKEGPFVHIAACVGHVISRLFPIYRKSNIKYRELIVACTGAGISVAFGAPIGGVVFSIEEITYFFSHHSLYQALICSIVSALMLQRLDPTHTGKLTMFQVKYHHSWHWFELFAFVLLGYIGGVVGSCITFFNTKIVQLRKKSWIRNYPVAEVACILLCTGIISYFNEFMNRSSLEFLSDTYHECKRYDTSGICDKNEFKSFLKLLGTAIIASFLSIVSFGAHVPCGIFVPSLYVGACIGRAVGIWMKVLQVNVFPEEFLPSECHRGYTCVHPAIYAIVGSLAVLAGTCRMTVSLVIIAFEMTGGIQYLVPCAIATMVAKAVGDWIGVKSIYEEHLKLTEYPYLDPGKSFNFDFIVKDLNLIGRDMTVLLSEGETLRDIHSKITSSLHHGYPIVSAKDDATVIGYISRLSLSKAVGFVESTEKSPSQVKFQFRSQINTAQCQSENTTSREGGIFFDASRYCENAPIQISPSTTVTRVLHLFEALGLHHALIVQNAKLIGILTKKDLLKFIQGVENVHSQLT